VALDPIIRKLLDALAAMHAPALESMTPDQARATYRAGRTNANPEPVDRVENLEVRGGAGNVGARLYAPSSSDPLPCLVYYHGGGWLFGDIETHDAVCRAFSNLAQCAVVSVDYRLAPEHKFPAAADDAYAALVDVHTRATELGIASNRIGVGGDSAGGALAAATALRARDLGGPALRLHLMINPVTDYNFETASYTENGEGYFLTAATMRWFWDNYLATEDDGANPYASPLRAESLSGLPLAVVATAEYDPLRDEGDAYARRIAREGGRVTHLQLAGLTHEFIHMAAIVPACRAALNQLAAELKKALE
jgi:acetyl esterase